MTLQNVEILKDTDVEVNQWILANSFSAKAKRPGQLNDELDLKAKANMFLFQLGKMAERIL